MLLRQNLTNWTRRQGLRISLRSLSGMESPRTGDKRRLTPSNSEEDTDKKFRTNSPHTEDLAVEGSSKPPNGIKEGVSATSKLAKAARKHRKKLLKIEPCSHDDVFWREVIELLGQDAVDAAIEEDSDFRSPFDFKEEVELSIVKLSSNGKRHLYTFT